VRRTDVAIRCDLIVEIVDCVEDTSEKIEKKMKFLKEEVEIRVESIKIDLDILAESIVSKFNDELSSYW
jgi:hypothetical protein